MRLLLRFFLRLLLGLIGLSLAIPFGGFVIAAGIVVDPAVRQIVLDLVRAGLTAGFWDAVQTLSLERVFDAITAVAKSMTLAVTMPPVLTAAIGETLRFRTLAWYGGACGLLAASLPFVAREGVRLPIAGAVHAGEARLTTLFFLAGAASGLVYWLIAGRSAGPSRSSPTPASDVLATGSVLDPGSGAVRATPRTFPAETRAGPKT